MMSLIDEYLLHLRAGGRAQTTIDARRRMLDLLDWEMHGNIAQATTTDLELFIAEHGHRSDATKATYSSHLRSFYPWLTAKGYRTDDPTAGLIKPKRPRPKPRPVNDHDLERALSMSNSGWRLIITLAAYGGFRANEIRNLLREDVTERTILVWKGKGNKDAEIPCHPRIWQLVAPLPDGYVVVPHPKSSTHLSAMARRHFDRIGLPKVTLHKFRHSFGTNLHRFGTDSRTAQELLRHASLSSTQIYIDVTRGQMQTAIDQLPDIGPKDTAA